MAHCKYFVTSSALRDLKKIADADRRRIGRKLQYFISVDDPLGFAIQLTGVKPPIYRYRIGKYRIFFSAQGNTLHILNVSLRGKAYR